MLRRYHHRVALFPSILLLRVGRHAMSQCQGAGSGCAGCSERIKKDSSDQGPHKAFVKIRDAPLRAKIIVSMLAAATVGVLVQDV